MECVKRKYPRRYHLFQVYTWLADSTLCCCLSTPCPDYQEVFHEVTAKLPVDVCVGFLKLLLHLLPPGLRDI